MHGQKVASSGATPTGLGKGLAGILGETLAVAPTSGVAELLSSQKVRRSSAVREMVIEAAISAIASAFSSDGVVIARRESAGHLAAVASELPASWVGLDPLMFEISGQLWKLLESGSEGQTQDEIDGYNFLLCLQSGQDGPTAAAVIRKQPFDEKEVHTVGRLVRSIGFALNDSFSFPSSSSLAVSSEPYGDSILADVRLGIAQDCQHTTAVAEDMATAVAVAAAELCDPNFDVQFVGQTTVEKKLVTMVVLGDDGGGPLFGLSVTDLASSNGPVEAVFGAARVIGRDPFSSPEPADLV